MNASLRRGLGIALLGAAAALGAWALTPTRPLATLRGELKLEQDIPKVFADWRAEPTLGVAVVNPQQEAMIKLLYSQTLVRSYVDRRGQRIVLSIAYGTDQRDGMQMHYPEVCYPAQGYQVLSKRNVTLRLTERELKARRVETRRGEQYNEPLTYWTVVGDQVVYSGSEKKVVELGYGLRGMIPDGLLVRVSSIGADSEAAFALQQRFIDDLVGALDARTRPRLVGRAR